MTLKMSFLRGLDSGVGDELWRVDRSNTVTVYGLGLIDVPTTYPACLGWLCRDSTKRQLKAV